MNFSVSDKDPEVTTILRHLWFGVGSLQEETKNYGEMTPPASCTRELYLKQQKHLHGLQPVGGSLHTKVEVVNLSCRCVQHALRIKIIGKKNN